ncbi:hypothetical protein G3567_07585 [Psychroflexus sp. YR1-1]|uniref:Outer membrane protein beta-barrel domain-containing protein n=1 Tax=Psychroflexus aurantiacus TaxID=2709310 RepID=A0A6B3R0C7_9FLAO|nr:hypothetical protein [Psychroflexus aurantiacus]NEV94006.1 hypothetical protein [Psychroflexus aurantiacus]
MNKINIKRKRTGIFQSAVLIAFTLLLNPYCFSQTDFSLSVGTQFQFSNIQLESSQFENHAETGLGVVAGISLGLNESFSLHSGIALNYFESRHSVDRYSGFEDAIDISDEAFEFRYTANYYSEQQDLTAISIPLTVQYETSGVIRFYARLGVEANFFISQEFSSRASGLTTTGFFPRFNAVLDSPRFAGFGTFDNQEFVGSELDVKNSYNATAELGVKQLYASGNALYIGVYYKHGMNDISSPGGSDGLLSFDPQNPTEFRSTSVLNAIGNPPNASQGLTDNARLHMFGVALRYEFEL